MLSDRDGDQIKYRPREGAETNAAPPEDTPIKISQFEELPEDQSGKKRKGREVEEGVEDGRRGEERTGVNLEI